MDPYGSYYGCSHSSLDVTSSIGCSHSSKCLVVWSYKGATLVAEGQATTTTQKECRRSKQEESITSAKRVGEEQSAIPRFGRHQTTTVPSHSKPLSRFPDSFKKASPFQMRC
jgi:hypothetical protein